MQQPTTPPKHTVAYQIFHYYFKCYMPQHQLYSDAYLSEVGVPTTMNRAIDRELANAPVLCQLTPAEMADKFANGATLTLQEPKDAVPVYQMIKEHLENWYVIVNDPLDYTEPPLEDLQKFEALAQALYPTARVYLNEDQLGNRLFKGLASLEAQHAMKRHPTNKDKEESFKLPKERTEIIDLINRAAFKKNRRWFDRVNTDAD
jgi:hypothetical protein